MRRSKVMYEAIRYRFTSCSTHMHPWRSKHWAHLIAESSGLESFVSWEVEQVWEIDPCTDEDSDEWCQYPTMSQKGINQFKSSCKKNMNQIRNLGFHIFTFKSSRGSI